MVALCARRGHGDLKVWAHSPARPGQACLVCVRERSCFRLGGLRRVALACCAGVAGSLVVLCVGIFALAAAFVLSCGTMAFVALGVGPRFVCCVVVEQGPLPGAQGLHSADILSLCVVCASPASVGVARVKVWKPFVAISSWRCLSVIGSDICLLTARNTACFALARSGS